MDFPESIDDVFTSRKLRRTSVFYKEDHVSDSSLFRAIELDIPSIKLDNPYAPTKTLDQDLRLPNVSTFAFGPLWNPESADQSTISTESEPQDQEDDLWKIAFDLGPANKDVAFFTWEDFEAPGFVEPRSAYISEAGTEAFDAALQQHAQIDKSLRPGRVVRLGVLINSMVNLGLGRSSLLFRYDEKRKTFLPVIEDGRISGCSFLASRSLLELFLTCGNTFRQLSSFVERTYASTNTIPALVVLANSVSTILSAFESHIGEHSKAIESPLQLQQLFSKPREILVLIKAMVDAGKSAKSNEELASAFYHLIESTEQGDSMKHQLSTKILSSLCNPWLELVGEWTGLQEDCGSLFGPTMNCFFATSETPEGQDMPEYIYNADMMPVFIPEEDGRMIFETGNSLRFLRSHHPDHPLAIPRKYNIVAPSLQWMFSWQDMESVTEKAKEYEKNVLAALQAYRTGRTISDCNSYTAPQAIDQVTEVDFERYLQGSIQILDGTPTHSLHGFPEELRSLTVQLLSARLTNEFSESSTFAPPLSITPFLSFMPILAAQARLVNTATLRLFFRSHQLRTHLSIQRNYHLLGDGVFSSRLSTALFSPELEAAERRKGTVRSGINMGLNLGSRATWPPASSELRLALMGVLSESYHSSHLYLSTLAREKVAHRHISGMREHEELPGQLNFAIRTLSELEMEKIMDPHSLHALDFLRLQYVPPSPLHLVITSTALEKYDNIFKFLLRLNRMLFVISHLPRGLTDAEARRFRIEAHHFVTAVASYVFQSGIRDQWGAFEQFLDSIEIRLQQEDEAGEVGTLVKEGLQSLRTAHDQCLDRILFSLLLRRRQKQIMTLLEEIFDCVLLFSKLHMVGRLSPPTTEHTPKDRRDEDNVKDLYARFKGKVRVFLSVCRGLTGKRDYGNGKGTGEENTIERLLIYLEMSRYYQG
ncbi:hypothetical protein K432DRAFT_289496 [Lepidopterella palustris CBS 459.81]|uniref:Spindle pole body component n=1 Tax=Lepidopterella palustris CBS 459.81 TaxID=1314670 RepID=A0A8E2JJB8_9PEZI|nr:hypothetical protein K432DRAFT_289496 [Lepidopterella palustris CBS 459.81]